LTTRWFNNQIKIFHDDQILNIHYNFVVFLTENVDNNLKWK